MSSKAHILIAGIGGFIGKRLAEIAADQGFRVSGFDQDIRNCRDLSGSGVHILEADITDPLGYQTLLDARPDVVVNTVAVVKETGDWGLFRRINVEATTELARLAKKAGVRQFIQLSSVMVYGLHAPDHITEEGPFAGDNNPYCTTKIEGEAELKKHGDERFGITLIRPADVYGPGSIPWVVRPLEMRKKGLFMLVDGGKGRFNPVFVDNLVHAILQTIEQKKYNETYNIVDGCLSNREYFNGLMHVAGYGDLFSLPSTILYPLSKGLVAVSGWLNMTPDLTPQAIEYMLRPGAYSGDKAKRELGYTSSVSLEQGMALTNDWLNRERPDLVKK